MKYDDNELCNQEAIDVVICESISSRWLVSNDEPMVKQLSKDRIHFKLPATCDRT
jgi:hypothetical protein